MSPEVGPQKELPRLSNDEGPLELAAHEAEVEGTTAVGLDVAAVGGHEVDAGVGRLPSVGLGCSKHGPGDFHIYH